MLGKTQNKIFMEQKITKLKLSVFIFHFISYMRVIFYTGFCTSLFNSKLRHVLSISKDKKRHRNVK